ncbi:hypothetical protein N431DRAFT_425004 [Stipitochalara longipes BDJ]|nr:hypothetical protein N431DRAFT_425004 [Stipitochalara longipes BDJ]
MLARRGGAKPAGLIGCAVPRQQPFEVPQRQRYRVLLSPSLLVQKSKIQQCECNELHDADQCFKYRCRVIWGRRSYPEGRGVPPSASFREATTQLKSSSPGQPGPESILQPKAACKFRGVYFRIESPFARNALPGTLSALRGPRLAIDFCQNESTPPLGTIRPPQDLSRIRRCASARVIHKTLYFPIG